MMRRSHLKVWLAAVAISWLVVALAAGCGSGKVDSAPVESSQLPTSADAAPTGNESSRPVAPTKSRSHLVPVSVFYVDAHGNLVAKKAQVDAYGDRIEEALAIAGTTPNEVGLTNAYSADSFDSASLDGYGSHGGISVGLSNRSVEAPHSGWTSAEAQMAIRAAVCTARVSSTYPVTFILHRKPVTQLFGEPLQAGVVNNAHCPQARVDHGWLQTIPDIVRVDANIHTGRDGTISKQSRRVHQASLLGISCAKPPDLDAGAVDRIGVSAPDYPGDARTLYLYLDAEQARERFTRTRSWLAGCSGDEACCTTRLRASRLGDESLLEVTTDVGTGAGPTGRWLRLIVVGNALLLTDSDDGSLPGRALERDVRRQGHDLAPVIREMDVFSAS